MTAYCISPEPCVWIVWSAVSIAAIISGLYENIINRFPTDAKRARITIPIALQIKTILTLAYGVHGGEKCE